MEIMIEPFDSTNIQHVKILDSCQDKDLLYFLGKILDKKYITDSFYFVKDVNYVGFFYFSNPVMTFYGKTISLYYGVFSDFRNQGYGNRIVKKATSYIFSNFDVDMIVSNVNKENRYSVSIFEKNGYTEIFEDQDDFQYICKR